MVTLGGDLVRIAPEASTSPVPVATSSCSACTSPTPGQHLEHRLFVDHAVPHCRSNVVYKGALQGDGRAHGLDRRRADPRRRRSAPTPTRSTATWCSPTARAPTRCRTSRSRPARSSAPGTPAPPVGSTTSSCSTCSRAASRPTRRAGSWCAASSPTCIGRIGVPEVAGAAAGARRGRARPGRGALTVSRLPAGLRGRRRSPTAAAMRVELDGVPVASSAPRARSTRSTTSARTPTSRCPRARSTARPSSAGCTARASTCVTGQPTGLPATEPVPVYPVKIDGDDVLRRPSHPEDTGERSPDDHPGDPRPARLRRHRRAAPARSCAASTSPSGRARRTRSWARTARASRRWPTRSPVTRSTPSPAAPSPSTAPTCWR